MRVKITLPFWQESVALALRAASLFPRLKFTGLDIAVSVEGPQLIEVNEYPAIIDLSYFQLKPMAILDPGLYS